MNKPFSGRGPKLGRRESWLRGKGRKLGELEVKLGAKRDKRNQWIEKLTKLNGTAGNCAAGGLRL